jgi:uncharacterized protein (UPF0332 family)
MRREKATESLRAAESCLTMHLLNSCASRCYYAMFQAAVVALEAVGFHRDAWSHIALQATFTNELIYRRKLYPRQLAEYLNRALFWRNIADYGEAEINQRRAKQLVNWAQAFVAKVTEVTGREIR